MIERCDQVTSRIVVLLRQARMGRDDADMLRIDGAQMNLGADVERDGCPGASPSLKLPAMTIAPVV